MVIGIIGAMEEEVAALKEAMEIQEIVEKASMTFCKGVLCGKDVVVVRRGAHEIISAELVTRIRKELDEVVRPLLEKRPVLLKVVEITRSLSHSEDELEHVTCLFHRHVLLVLSVGITNRPDTQVMRSPFEVITT